MTRLLAVAFCAGLLAAACGSSGATPSGAASGSATPAPTATPTVAVTPSATVPPTPTPTPTATPFPTGKPGALAFVKAYEDALIAGNYANAWSMLASGGTAGWGTLAKYTTERKAFMKSAGTKYTLQANPPDTLSLADWLSGTSFAGSIDKTQAVLVRVDWAALSSSGSGWEMWVANPIPAGWELYEVR
jgi:hypothetical protein